MFNNIASVAECKKRDVEGHFMTFNTIGIVSGEFVYFQSRGFAPCKVLASTLTISGQERGVMWQMSSWTLSLLNTTNVSAVSCRCTVNGMHLNQFRKSELTKRTVQKNHCC